jgi:hypothetical protein
MLPADRFEVDNVITYSVDQHRAPFSVFSEEKDRVVGGYIAQIIIYDTEYHLTWRPMTKRKPADTVLGAMENLYESINTSMSLLVGTRTTAGDFGNDDPESPDIRSSALDDCDVCPLCEQDLPSKPGEKEEERKVSEGGAEHSKASDTLATNLSDEHSNGGRNGLGSGGSLVSHGGAYGAVPEASAPPVSRSARFE